MFQNHRQYNRRKEFNNKPLINLGNNIESIQWTFRIDYPSDAHVSNIINKLYDRRWAYIASVRNNHNNLTLVTTGIIIFNVPRSLNWLHQNISTNAKWNTLVITPQQWIQNFQ
jgi:hypothetical protein